jgi:hypothetical protein
MLLVIFSSFVQVLRENNFGPCPRNRRGDCLFRPRLGSIPMLSWTWLGAFGVQVVKIVDPYAGMSYRPGVVRNMLWLHINACNMLVSVCA